MTGAGATVAPTGDRTGGWAAIVLAGGRASRMAGTDKIRADVGGQSVLARVLAACEGARIVVVGPPELADVVGGAGLLVREHPPFDGPVAACRAGLAALDVDNDRPPTGARSRHPSAMAPGAAVKDWIVAEDASGQAGAAGSSVAGPGPARAGAPGARATPEAATYRRLALLAGDQPHLTPEALAALHAALDTTHGDAAVLADATGHRQHLCALWEAGSLRAALADAGPSMRSLYAAAEVRTVPDRWGASRDIDTPADLRRARCDLG